MDLNEWDSDETTEEPVDNKQKKFEKGDIN